MRIRVWLLASLAALRAGGASGDVELVAPGVLSTPLNERSAGLTPSGDTLYFAVRSGDGYVSELFRSRRLGGRWTTPEALPFSGRFVDLDPSVSPDGRTLYFASDRPAPGKSAADFDLWSVALSGDAHEPVRLPPPINSPSTELAPALTADDRLLFASDRPGGFGGLDLYWTERRGDSTIVRSFGTPVNSQESETQATISPDGSTLVFTSVGRSDELLAPGAAYPRGDLYLSRRTGASWSPPIHLSAPINSPAAECCAAFDKRGAYLYFSSERNFTLDQRHDSPGLTRESLERGLGDILNGGGNLFRVSALELGTFERRAMAPDTLPVLVGPGTISTAANEFGGTLSPDGTEIFFSRSVPRSYAYAIFGSRLSSGHWSAPEVVPFSGHYRDFDPVFAPDGRRMYFISDRPVDGRRPTNYDIYVIERDGAVWGTPRRLPAPINTSGNEWFMSEADDGTLYFAAQRDGSGPSRIYQSARGSGGYADPVPLPEAVNAPGLWVTEPSIARDQRFLVFSGTRDGIAGYDLYVSYRLAGGWSPAERLTAHGMASPTRDYSPRLAPDGLTLIFTSERYPTRQDAARPMSYADFVTFSASILNGHGNIYSIPLKAAGIVPPEP